MAPATRNSEYLILRANEDDSWKIVKSGVLAKSREAALSEYLNGLTGAEGEAEATGSYVALIASNWITKPVKPKTGFEIG